MTPATGADGAIRAIRFPFGDWLYLPSRALNLVKLAAYPAAGWRPAHVSIALTSRCLRSCDFCYAGSSSDGTTAWTLPDLVTLVKSCDDNGVFGVSFGGGEPLLWRDARSGADLYDLLSELGGVGCTLSFTTSAEPGVSWRKVPRYARPRLSVHQPAEAAGAVAEVKRAQDLWGGVPAVNLLVRKGQCAAVQRASGELLSAGVRDILLLPLQPWGRAAGSADVPGDDELELLLSSLSCGYVKLGSCRRPPGYRDTFLGCGAGDWLVSLDHSRRLRACSFQAGALPLRSLDAEQIIAAMPCLPRLPCHTRISVCPSSSSSLGLLGKG